MLLFKTNYVTRAAEIIMVKQLCKKNKIKHALSILNAETFHKVFLPLYYFIAICIMTGIKIVNSITTVPSHQHKIMV